MTLDPLATLITQAQQQIAILEAELDAAKASEADLAAQLSSLATQLSTAQQNIQSLEADLAAAYQQLESLLATDRVQFEGKGTIDSKEAVSANLLRSIINVKAGHLVIALAQRDYQSRIQSINIDGTPMSMIKRLPAKTAGFSLDVWAAIAATDNTSALIEARYSDWARWGTLSSYCWSGPKSALPVASSATSALSAASTSRLCPSVSTRENVLAIAVGTDWDDIRTHAPSLGWAKRADGLQGSIQFVFDRHESAGFAYDGSAFSTAGNDRYVAAMLCFPTAAVPATTPVVSLAASPASVSEDGTTNLIYTFTRTGDTALPLTVNYTVGGTATNGTDYSGISTTGTIKTVTFAAGSAIAVVTVDPTADSTVEPDETVVLTLAAGTGYTIGTTGGVTGTISNDDAAQSPQPSPTGSIPLTWDDPRFVNMTDYTAREYITANASRSNMSSVYTDTNYPAWETKGSVNLRTSRARTREGYRSAGGGEQYLSDLYVEATGVGADHADGLQVYAPGLAGRITLKNSTIKAPSGNAAYFSSDNWMGAHVLENVLLSGGGYTLRIYGDGATSMSLKDVYILKDSWLFGPTHFVAVNNLRPAVVRWENVRLATIENGKIVPGSEIPQPYGIARDYTDAIAGTDGADVFMADAAKGDTYVGGKGNNTYKMTDYSQSLFSNMDWLTDFKIGQDTIDGPNDQPIVPVVISQKAAAFTEPAIATLLNAPGNFPLNGAAIFKQGGIDGERVFLALNSGVTGYSPTKDAIIEITGYSGNLASLRVA